jgi:hypothetical protein
MRYNPRYEPRFRVLNGRYFMKILGQYVKINHYHFIPLLSFILHCNNTNAIHKRSLTGQVNCRYILQLEVYNYRLPNHDKAWTGYLLVVSDCNRLPRSMSGLVSWGKVGEEETMTHLMAPRYSREKQGYYIPGSAFS